MYSASEVTSFVEMLESMHVGPVITVFAAHVERVALFLRGHELVGLFPCGEDGNLGEHVHIRFKHLD